MKARTALDQPAQPKLKSKDPVIHFEEGLVGFSEFKDFVLMENSGLAPFWLLQSLESPSLGFLVLEASTLVPNYNALVPAREWESLGLAGERNARAFVIVVVGPTPEASTGNFQAPLLVNCGKMVGKQVILTDSGFSVRQPLV